MKQSHLKGSGCDGRLQEGCSCSGCSQNISAQMLAFLPLTTRWGNCGSVQTQAERVKEIIYEWAGGLPAMYCCCSRNVTLLKFSEVCIWEGTEETNFWSSSEGECCSSAETFTDVKCCIAVGGECTAQKLADLYATKSTVTLPWKQNITHSHHQPICWWKYTILSMCYLLACHWISYYLTPPCSLVCFVIFSLPFVLGSLFL